MRRVALDPRRAAIHLATAVSFAALSGLPGPTGDPVAYAWLAVALLDLAFTTGWKRMLSGHGEDADFSAPPAGGIVMTGSISSSVRLDYDAGTAEKTYAPGRLVRALYRLSFQAPFPYSSNRAAVEAARRRRDVVGLLTEYWYGENLVARAVDVRQEADGRIVFVTELVRGTAPRDLARAKALLADLTSRFLESGLPSWQVGWYNPRSSGNLIEREDGSFRIIDLESNLVTPILPAAAAVRAIRAGLYPSFDEIDMARLNDYLAQHRAAIIAALGEAKAARLFVAAMDYGEAQQAWHAGEPRVVSKMLRFAFRLIDVPTWWRSAPRLTQGGEKLAEGFVSAGIATWESEGRISAAEAAAARDSLALPEVASATGGLGAHMAISVPLRFPFGSIARSAWTLSLRAKGEWDALRGRAAGRRARQVHTLTVAFVAAIPGVGTFAYTLARPLRQQRVLGAIAMDQLFRHLPLRAYARAHLDSLTLWMAKTPAAAVRGSVLSRTRRQVVAVAGGAAIGLVVLSGNAAVFALAPADVAADLYFAEAALAGVVGVMAFQSYWRQQALERGLDEAAGMFLWAAGGVFVLGVAIDYGLGVHEAVFGWTAAHLNLFPLLTDPSEKLIILAYGAIAAPVLLLLRHEMAAGRASSAWLSLSLAGAAALVASVPLAYSVELSLATLGAVSAIVLTAFGSRRLETQRPASNEGTAVQRTQVARVAVAPSRLANPAECVR